MLRRLQVRDYYLIRELNLEFASGLTVLTGETGAGKSMILGALDVLLGERFPRNAVPDGRESAVIEGEFKLADHSGIQTVLSDDEDAARTGELILRREMNRQGRSRSWLNDRPFPQDDLPKLRELLADFHGQRDHQSLFKSARQLEYLDVFADAQELAAHVARLFERRQGQRRERERLLAALSAHRKDHALLEYQLQEIERLGLQPGEEETVEARLIKLESAEKLAAEAMRLLGVLSEAEPSLVSLCGQARQVAAGIAKVDRDLSAVSDELADLAARLKDVSSQVRHYAETLSFDEAELVRLRERRSALWELRRKHGLTLEQILSRAAELKTLLDAEERLQQQGDDLDRTLAATDDEFCDTARRLSVQRHTAAADFAASISELLKPLGFAHAQFEAALTSQPEPLSADALTESGADRLEFLFTANPGRPMAPLREVASGGESSRVTLAIKAVLSDKADYPLLVYDEIDFGISGKVADQVGAQLLRLAKRHQVIVITHLPQIASRADHQLSVQKVMRNGGAETIAQFLMGEARVQAVAALIAGTNITEKALASARELLQLSRKTKPI
jgi:DNA repair protein RecN (Recombination protein N)